MPTRARSAEPESSSTRKKTRLATINHYDKIATFENAEAVDKNPPLPKLLDAVKNQHRPSDDGSAVVYWMRMQDMRSELNTIRYTSNI